MDTEGARKDVRIPPEVIDKILLHLPVTFAISLGRAHVKRILLRKLNRPDLWESFDIDVLTFVLKYQIKGFQPHILISAALKGRLDILTLIRANPTDETRGQWPEGLVTAAASTGHLATLDWLVSNGFDRKTTGAAMKRAVVNGHLNCVRFFTEKTDVECTAWEFDVSAFLGHFELANYLMSNRLEGGSTQAMDMSAKAGKLDVVRWLHHNYNALGCTTEAMDGAAENNHLPVVAFLHRNRGEGCTGRALVMSASRGHLNVVRWLHTKRPELRNVGSDALDLAAGNGHLEVVRFLTENGYPATTYAMDFACRYGYLSVARYLHLHRREGFTKFAIYLAGMAGHFEVVEFLVLYANAEGTREKIDWLIENSDDAKLVALLNRNYKRIVRNDLYL